MLATAARRCRSPDNNEACTKANTTARQVANETIHYQTQSCFPYTYRFTHVLPGRYVIETFLDRDGDGGFGYGNPWPYIPSEPVAILQDTVKVRSRWPNEGNDILFR